MDENYYIGLDGGGTKTHVVCVTKQCTIKGECWSGSTNVNSVGQVEAFKNFSQALDTLLTNTNLKKEQIASICLGMAGVDSPEDKEDRMKWVTKYFAPHVPKTLLVNDGVIALVSGTKKLHGIVVISGTGTIVLGVNDNDKGKEVRASGWGPLLGDEGSGFALGQGVLKAVCHAEDGGPSTILTKLVLQELKLDNVRKIIDWTYKDVTWARFAALSTVLQQAVKAGDAVAKKILDSNAVALVDNIKLVYKKGAFSGKVPLVFSGGNLTCEDGKGVFVQRLKEILQAEQVELPNLEFIFPNISAPVAAAYLAIENQ